MREIGTMWTLDMIEELKTRLIAGESAQQIAGGMMMTLNVGRITRDMVLGMKWRLGLCEPRKLTLDEKGHVVKRRPRPRQRPPAGDHPFRRHSAQARRKRDVGTKTHTALGQWTSDTKRMTAPQLPVDGIHEVPGMRLVALEDLEREHCRWPMWAHDRKPWNREAVFYCGASALDGCSYCEHHAAIAYVGVGRINTWVNPQQ